MIFFRADLRRLSKRFFTRVDSFIPQLKRLFHQRSIFMKLEYPISYLMDTHTTNLYWSNFLSSRRNLHTATDHFRNMGEDYSRELFHPKIIYVSLFRLYCHHLFWKWNYFSFLAFLIVKFLGISSKEFKWSLQKFSLNFLFLLMLLLHLFLNITV